MTVVTWTSNVNPHDRTARVILRNGLLVLNIGEAADLTSDEINSLRSRLILTPGGAPFNTAPFIEDIFLADGVVSKLASGGGTTALLLGHTILDETSPLAQRRKLSFAGAGVTATDDGANDQTIVTIPGGGGGGSSAPTIVTAGNLGATRSQTVLANEELWLIGTLNANHVLTLTMGTGGCLRLFGIQGGSHSLTVSDGSTSEDITSKIPSDASANFEVAVFADGTDLHVVPAPMVGPQGSQGVQGIQGIQGIQGLTGAQGNPGAGAGVMVKLASNVTNGTTSFADVTGLSFPVTNGRRYRWEAHIAFKADSTGNGSGWSANGPTFTDLSIRAVWGNTSVNTSGYNGGAWDTAVASGNSPSTVGAVAFIEGIVVPSADGTVIMRFISELATGGALITAKAGSYLTYEDIT